MSTLTSPSALEQEIAELDSQIKEGAGMPAESFGRAITPRQEIQNKIGEAYRLAKNHKELAEVAARRLTEQKQQLAEMEVFAATAKAKIDQARFSSRRLELAMQAESAEQFSRGLCAVDDTVDALSWWIDSHKQRIARQREEVAKIDRILLENQRLAARYESERESAEAALKSFDRLNHAESLAERAKAGASLDGKDW